MALEIQKPDQPLGLVSDRTLYLAGDKWTLCEAGDTKAAYGLVQAGGMISAEDAARLHLTVKGGKVAQLSREEAFKASGQEMPLPAEAPKAEFLVKPTPLPPPPPTGDATSGATPQTPPSAPAAVPADAKGKASASAQTPEEAARLRDRAERMSSGDMTTPVPEHGEPLRAEPESETSTARKSTARKGGAKKAGAKKRGA